MKSPRGFLALHVRAKERKTNYLVRTARYGLIFGLLMLAASFTLSPTAFGQVQQTISCPAGHGYWDVLSVMMMDPGLAADHHMEGFTKGVPSAYIYTRWDPSDSKIYYTKNPQGNPWDINLYDSNYVYQWVTELDEYNGVNHWNDPKSCRKFNNGHETSTSDFSMRWAPRCAAPGGENSTLWNSIPSSSKISTKYFTYVDHVQQTLVQDLDYAQLELEPTGTLEITDHRADPPRSFSITTLPLDYTYSCTVQGNTNSCKFREVFEYGIDTNVNPVDKIKHTYGWVRWRYYINSTHGNKDMDADWVLNNTSMTDNLMPGQVPPKFECF
jgi:hypothetical protein